MNKTGFVGFGNMGGTMLKALLKAGAMPQDQVIVFNRTPEKLKSFSEEYPMVNIAASINDLATKCERIFICTATDEVKPVLAALMPGLPENAHVISIAGTIEMRCLESVFDGKITRIMPTMISEVGEGVTLVCHNNKVQAADREFVNDAFSKIGKVKEILEDRFDLAADLTSCSPAFYAAILHNLVEIAVQYGYFGESEIKELVLSTCYGTTKLLTETGTDFTGLISRVATKGGISEEGVRVLNDRLPATFDELLAVTMDKHRESKQMIREQFGVE